MKTLFRQRALIFSLFVCALLAFPACIADSTMAPHELHETDGSDAEADTTFTDGATESIIPEVCDHYRYNVDHEVFLNLEAYTHRPIGGVCEAGFPCRPPSALPDIGGTQAPPRPLFNPLNEKS